MFIAQLSKMAQDDIRARVESALNWEFGYPIVGRDDWKIMQKNIEDAMDEKVENVVPSVEWTEWTALDGELRNGIYFMGDEDDEAVEACITKMLDVFAEYQADRAKRFGY